MNSALSLSVVLEPRFSHSSGAQLHDDALLTVVLVLSGGTRDSVCDSPLAQNYCLLAE